MTNVKVTLAKPKKPERKTQRKQSTYAALSQALRQMAKLKFGESAAVWRQVKEVAEKYDVDPRELRVAPVRAGDKVKKVDILRPDKQNEKLLIEISGDKAENIKFKVIPVRKRKTSQSSFSEFRKLFVRGGGTASEAGTVWKQLREQANVESSGLFVEDDGYGKIIVRKQGKGSARVLVANVKVSK